MEGSSLESMPSVTFKAYATKLVSTYLCEGLIYLLGLSLAMENYGGAGCGEKVALSYISELDLDVDFGADFDSIPNSPYCLIFDSSCSLR